MGQWMLGLCRQASGRSCLVVAALVSPNRRWILLMMRLDDMSTFFPAFVFTIIKLVDCHCQRAVTLEVVRSGPSESNDLIGGQTWEMTAVSVACSLCSLCSDRATTSKNASRFKHHLSIGVVSTCHARNSGASWKSVLPWQLEAT